MFWRFSIVLALLVAVVYSTPAVTGDVRIKRESSCSDNNCGGVTLVIWDLINEGVDPGFSCRRYLTCTPEQRQCSGLNAATLALITEACIRATPPGE